MRGQSASRVPGPVRPDGARRRRSGQPRWQGRAAPASTRVASSGGAHRAPRGVHGMSQSRHPMRRRRRRRRQRGVLRSAFCVLRSALRMGHGASGVRHRAGDAAGRRATGRPRGHRLDTSPPQHRAYAKCCVPCAPRLDGQRAGVGREPAPRPGTNHAAGARRTAAADSHGRPEVPRLLRAADRPARPGAQRAPAGPGRSARAHRRLHGAPGRRVSSSRDIATAR